MENMITVKNLRKEFKKTIKEPGIKGSIKSFFNPKSEIVEAVKDISFTAEKGEYSVLSDLTERESQL